MDEADRKRPGGSGVVRSASSLP